MALCGTRIEHGVAPTLEFSEEMDELFFWLDETEHILNSSVKPADEEFLEDSLEKVKVSPLLHRNGGRLRDPLAAY